MHNQNIARGLREAAPRTTRTLWQMLSRRPGDAAAMLGRPSETMVQLAVNPPDSRIVDIVMGIVGGRPSVPLHWLEKRLAEDLYDEELHKGAWVLDIGMWGHGLFQKAAGRILDAMRCEGVLVEIEVH